MYAVCTNLNWQKSDQVAFDKKNNTKHCINSIADKLSTQSTLSPVLIKRPLNLKGRGGGGYVFLLKKYSDSQCC